jgi:RND family efflux transporter MFP subunit
MKNKIIHFFTEHKIRTAIILIILIAGGYYGYKYFFPAATSVQYITQTAEKTTITVSVSGSGQVSELNSIDLKPGLGTSNTVISKVNFKTGDQVKAGDVIAILDQKNSLSSLNQVRASLASARANLANVLAGPTAIDVQVQQRSVTQAEQNYNNALTSLDLTKKSTALSVAQAQKTYDDITTINPPSQKRDSVLNTIQDKLTSAKTTLDAENKIITDENAKYVLGAQNPASFANTQTGYNQSLPLLNTAYNSLATAKQYESDDNINKAVSDTLNVLNEVLYSLNNFYTALQGTVSGSQVSQTQLDSYKSTVSGSLSSINSGISSMQSARQTLTDAITSARNGLDSANLTATSQLNSAQNQIQSSYNSWQAAKDQLTKLTAPATDQEISSARSQVISAQASLEQAQNNYDNTIITAPFDGQIAAMDVQIGDQVSGSTVMATLIANQEIAVLSLNEVDAAKIKVGDKVITTFDAIDGLSITGKVLQIDMLGTVSQGVVTYTVKVSFDTQDDRVKPDMSANCEIITDAKVDIIAVPNSAVKTNNSGSYVQMLDTSGQPQNKTVTVGIANESMTEITSGLNEGDKVVTQTITTGTTAKTKSQSTSGLGSLLGGGGPGR